MTAQVLLVFTPLFRGYPAKGTKDLEGGDGPKC